MSIMLAAVNRRVDDARGTSGIAVDIPSGVMPYGDYGLRSSHHFGCLGIRVPACRTEWEELRCVGEVHDAARGSVAGFTEQDVADVFEETKTQSG